MEIRRKAIEKLDIDSVTVFLDMQGYEMVNVRHLPTIRIYRNQS